MLEVVYQKKNTYYFVYWIGDFETIEHLSNAWNYTATNLISEIR